MNALSIERIGAVLLASFLFGILLSCVYNVIIYSFSILYSILLNGTGKKDKNINLKEALCDYFKEKLGNIPLVFKEILNFFLIIVSAFVLLILIQVFADGIFRFSYLFTAIIGFFMFRPFSKRFFEKLSNVFYYVFKTILCPLYIIKYIWFYKF